jgi:hypothetical protein
MFIASQFLDRNNVHKNDGSKSYWITRCVMSVIVAPFMIWNAIWHRPPCRELEMDFQGLSSRWDYNLGAALDYRDCDCQANV